MRMPEPAVQRKCASCQEEEKEGAVQAKEEPGQVPALTPDAESRIQGLRGGGRPLAEPVRSYFEPRFGRDFSQVRVHTGPAASYLARSISARAFTVGSDVVFGGGQYVPESRSGGELLAHELTHVVQQGSAPETVQRAADPPVRITGSGAPDLSRSPLDVDGIMSDIQAGMTYPSSPLDSWLQILGEQTGEVAFAAAAPTTKKADPAPVPIDKALPIQAHFFPSWIHHTDQRALIVGGFHGDERPGYETADALVSELRSHGGDLKFGALAFHTLIIPRLNRGAIEDDLKGKPGYDTRCNRQLVDLNRNFPGGGKTSSPRCKNSGGAPVQPEVQGVIDVVGKFKPHRILTLHAISSAKKAGIFADPNTDPAAVELACGMAGVLPDESDRSANKLKTGKCNPVYPGDTSGKPPAEASLGRWGPTSIPGQTTPVVTMEAPEYKSLGTGTGPRTLDAFLRPVRGFLIDPAKLATEADRNLVRDVEALALADRRLFLTGRLPSTEIVYQRIRSRIEARVAELNTLSPPVKLEIVSHQRAFAEKVGKSSPQAEIVFNKLMMNGGAWDTLPDKYFKGGNRKKGVDKKAWLAESSATRLDVILRYSAMPGASRHHWGTDVDFNSTKNAKWEPGDPATGKKEGKLFKLGQWLQANASQAGFLQAYTPGRKAGHAEEAWHYSYEPIAKPLRDLYKRDVRLQEDVVDQIMADFGERAKKAGLTLPTDLESALKALKISDYVDDIGPGL
jgi:hypothetical protein